jgi:hypothetical protein
VACTKAKTRCDLIYPGCSRCVAKNITCGYGLPLPNTTVITSNAPSIQTEEPDLDITPTLDSEQPSMQLVSTRIDHFIPTQNSTTNLISADSLDSGIWSLGPVDTISTYTELAFSHAHGYSDSVSVFPNEFELNLPQSPSDKEVRPSVQVRPQDEPRLRLGFSNIEYSSAFGFDEIIPKVPKAFSARRAQKCQLSLNRSYVLCTLKSYPHMMFPGRNLPPFIHPFYGYGVNASGNEIAAHKSAQGPIANCAAIVKWYSVKNNDNTVFIWRTIRMEQERLLAEVGSSTPCLHDSLN